MRKLLLQLHDAQIAVLFVFAPFTVPYVDANFTLMLNGRYINKEAAQSTRDPYLLDRQISLSITTE